MHLGTKFFLLGRSNILDNEPEGNKIVFCLLKSVPFEPDRSFGSFASPRGYDRNHTKGWAAAWPQQSETIEGTCPELSRAHGGWLQRQHSGRSLGGDRSCRGQAAPSLPHLLSSFTLRIVYFPFSGLTTLPVSSAPTTLLRLLSNGLQRTFLNSTDVFPVLFEVLVFLDAALSKFSSLPFKGPSCP